MMLRIKDILWMISKILLQLEEPEKIHISLVGSLQIGLCPMLFHSLRR